MACSFQTVFSTVNIASKSVMLINKHFNYKTRLMRQRPKSNKLQNLIRVNEHIGFNIINLLCGQVQQKNFTLLVPERQRQLLPRLSERLAVTAAN